MKPCRDCGKSINPDLISKSNTCRCVDCYRTYERERRRDYRERRSKVQRQCPSCKIQHTSPGYCRSYCSSCFTEIETKRKKTWREENLETDNARLKRYRNSPKGRKTLKEWKTRNHTSKKYALIEEFGGKCSSCGYDRNAAALTFHHTDPSEKEDEIARMIQGNKSLDTIRKEAKKCILLCTNCHREEHYPHLTKD